MSRLDELYDNMLDEAPFNFKEGNKSYIFELARIYAKECVKASLDKASEKLCENLIDDEGIMVRDANKYCNSIINPENIILI